MFSLRSNSRVVVVPMLLLVVWTAAGGLILAAEGMTTAQDAAESAQGPVWALAYIVVLLLIGLGVFATVRGSKRRDRAKPEEFKSTVKHG